MYIITGTESVDTDECGNMRLHYYNYDQQWLE